MLTLPFHEVERRAGRAGLQKALAAMPLVFTYSDFVAAMRFRGGTAGDGAETCKVALSEARRDGWVVGLFGHWGGPTARQVPTYFNAERMRAHPAGRRAIARGQPLWRPWLERALGIGALSAVEIGRGPLEDAGWVRRVGERPLCVTGETAVINAHEDVASALDVQRRPAGWSQAMRGSIAVHRDHRGPLVAVRAYAALADALVFGCEAIAETDVRACLGTWTVADAAAFRACALHLQALKSRRGRSRPVVIDDAPAGLAMRLLEADALRSSAETRFTLACA